jgi:hypothetical protein
VAARLGLDDVQLGLAGERVGQHVAHPLGGGGGHGVDDEQRAHVLRVSSTSLRNREPRPRAVHAAMRPAALVAVEGLALSLIGPAYAAAGLLGEPFDRTATCWRAPWP